ncbi:hypothetical protein [uncultured Psychroserpens sp.]|uniref:hypothetical protein n=1 Tax=uncultured Psychroserpens sp. TaxID=255436 RepID=UPI00260A7322|nr:hypothetical protein [uncultured Psychroserpens sp.]
MKPYIYLLIFTMFVFSCNNDDDGVSNNEPTLHGEWSLINVSGGLAGIDDDFPAGLITWDFDLNSQELTVTNTNVELVIYDGLPTGTYDYAVMTSTGSDATIVINNVNYAVVSITSTSLVLDEGVAADGFLLTYTR